MKSIITTWALLCLFLANPMLTTVSATAIDDLDEVITYANQAKSNAITARSAAKDIAKLYFQLNNTNVAGEVAVILNEMQDLEEASDEIIYFAQSAANQNPAIDPDNLIDWASDLEGLGDFVEIEAVNLKNLIEANQRAAARAAYRKLRNLLNQQIALAKQIRLEAIALKAVAQTYNVSIELLYGGSVYTGSTTLGGFYAYNEDLQQYFYPTQSYDDNKFLDLPGGTYTFGSYDGYFDGTNSVTVTLDPNAVGSDGFIVVQLSYWSE